MLPIRFLTDRLPARVFLTPAPPAFFAFAAMLFGGAAATVWGQSSVSNRPTLVEKNVKTGVITVNVYDVWILGDRSEKYANPDWSRNQNRPFDFRKLEQIIFTPHDRSKGGIGYQTDEIQTIIFWEEMATDEAVRRIKNNDDSVAEAIVERLERFNPGWKTARALRARLETRKSVFKIKSQGQIETGLKELESLHARFPRDSYVESQIVGALLQLSESALRAEDPDTSIEYIERAAALFPGNSTLIETQKRRLAEARQLVAVSEKTQRTDAGNSIAKAQRVVRLTRDPDLRRRARIVIRNAEGLILASYETASAFEPINATRPVEKQIVHLMHDHLMQRDETGTLYGRTQMVTRVQPRNLNQQYVVDLQPGMKFSNGTPITAADVVATIEMRQNKLGEAYDAEWDRFIVDARQISPFTVEVNVRPHPRPDSLLYLPVLSRNAFAQFPKRGDPASRTPSAISGPYRLSVVYNDDVQLVANAEYRMPLQIGKIKFKRYAQRGIGQATNDLLQGRIHTISDPSPAQILQIRNAPAQFETRRIQPNSVWVLAVNHAKTVFGDKLNPNGASGARDLRRAVSMAIDRRGILDQYFNIGGRAKLSHAVISGPFPRQSKAYDPSVPIPVAQVDAAKSLVQRYSAFVKQRKLVLKYADHGDVVESSLAQIKRDLESVGFEVDLQKRPNNAFLRELKNGSFDLAYYQIEHDNVLFNIANLFDATPNPLGVGSNFMGYKNQKLSQMFQDLRTTKNSDEIWAIQNKIHRFIATESVVIPLWQLDTYIAYSRRLVGRTGEGEIKLPVDSSHIFRNVHQWYLKPQSN